MKVHINISISKTISQRQTFQHTTSQDLATLVECKGFPNSMLLNLENLLTALIIKSCEYKAHKTTFMNKTTMPNFDSMRLATSNSCNNYNKSAQISKVIPHFTRACDPYNHVERFNRLHMPMNYSQLRQNIKVTRGATLLPLNYGIEQPQVNYFCCNSSRSTQLYFAPYWRNVGITKLLSLNPFK